MRPILPDAFGPFARGARDRSSRFWQLEPQRAQPRAAAVCLGASADSTGSNRPPRATPSPDLHGNAGTRAACQGHLPGCLLAALQMQGPARLALLLALGAGVVAASGGAAAISDIRVMLRTHWPENWWLSLQRPDGVLEAIRLERCYLWTNQVKFGPGPAEYPGATWSRLVSVSVFGFVEDDDGPSCVDGPITSPDFDTMMIQPGQMDFAEDGDIALIDVSGRSALQQFPTLTETLSSPEDNAWRKGPFGVADWCGTAQGEEPVLRRVEVGFNSIHDPLVLGSGAVGPYCQQVVALDKACNDSSLSDCQLLDVTTFYVDGNSKCDYAQRVEPASHWTLGVTKPGLQQPMWNSTLFAIDGTTARGRCGDVYGPQRTATVVSLQRVLSWEGQLQIDPTVFGVLANVSTTRPYPSPSPAPTPDPVPTVEPTPGGGITVDPTWGIIAAAASIPALLFFICVMAREICCIIPMQHSPHGVIRGEDLVNETTTSTTRTYSAETGTWSSSTSVTHVMRSEHESWTWCSGRVTDARVLYTPYGNLPMDGVIKPYRGSRFVGCSPRICGIIAVTVICSSTGSVGELLTIPMVLTCFILCIVCLFPPWLLICSMLRMAQNPKPREADAGPGATALMTPDYVKYNDLP
ncbi:unnamed protein product, partial [Symbiodinium sp. KB8]